MRYKLYHEHQLSFDLLVKASCSMECLYSQYTRNRRVSLSIRFLEAFDLKWRRTFIQSVMNMFQLLHSSQLVITRLQRITERDPSAERIDSISHSSRIFSLSAGGSITCHAQTKMFNVGLFMAVLCLNLIL
jgi:hypothetical protein